MAEDPIMSSVCDLLKSAVGLDTSLADDELERLGREIDSIKTNPNNFANVMRTLSPSNEILATGRLRENYYSLDDMRSPNCEVDESGLITETDVERIKQATADWKPVLLKGHEMFLTQHGWFDGEFGYMKDVDNLWGMENLDEITYK